MRSGCCGAGVYLLFACLPAVAHAQTAGTRHALLVGCSEYDKSQLRPLPYTANDAEALRAALQSTGFEAENIVVMHDEAKLTRYRPLKKHILRELALLIEGMKREDVLVIALSGHGVQFKGEKHGYFCPVDARLDDKTSLLPMDGPGSLFELLRSCKAKQKLLIVNACRNDPASDLAFATRKLDLVDEDHDVAPEGVAAFYSCRAGQKSYYDPERKISLFFDHLSRAWKGEYKREPGKLTLEEVFNQTTIRTKADASRTLSASQVPEVKREYRGDWVILEKRRIDTTLTRLVLPKRSYPPYESWKGRTIHTKKKSLKIGHTDDAGNQVYLGTLKSLSYTVLDDQGGWLKVRHDNAAGWFDKADAVLDEDAPSYFTLMISREPKSDGWYGRRGSAWGSLREFDKAIADYTEALRIAPDETAWYGNRAIWFEQKGDFESALRDYSTRLALGVEARFHSHRATIYLHMKEYDRAEAEIQEALRLEPANASALNNRGRLALHRKEWDRAIKEFEALMRDGPGAPWLYNNRGLALLRRGECAPALADFEKALELLPNAGSHATLAWALAVASDKKCRDPKRAERLALKACDLSGNRSPGALGALAAAKAALGDFEQAILLQEKALEDPFYRKTEDEARQRLSLYREEKAYVVVGDPGTK